MLNQIHFGDCRASLRAMSSAGIKVQTCVTSPPYFGLRDYGHEGQIGLEQTPEAYIAELVEVFRCVREVLADDGTLWVNIGDSYANVGKWGGSSGGKHVEALHGNTGIGRGKRDYGEGLKNKDLIGIPWMLAFALRADGWYLRQDIIWHKPNPMPESVTDRCTKAHEYVFLLSKSARYFYDSEAVKEDAIGGQSGAAAMFKRADSKRAQAIPNQSVGTHRADREEVAYNGEKRNRRSVWTVTTVPYKGAHFATFPPALIEPCILAGTSERGHCPDCGARWVRTTGRECNNCGDMVPTQAKSCNGCGHVNDWKSGRAISAAHVATNWSTPGKGTPRLPGGFTNKTIDSGFAPTCDCGHDPVPDVVLDPFMGSGTTAAVAIQHGRQFIGCELNEDYKPLQDARIEAAYQESIKDLI